MPMGTWSGHAELVRRRGRGGGARREFTAASAASAGATPTQAVGVRCGAEPGAPYDPQHSRPVARPCRGPDAHADVHHPGWDQDERDDGRGDDGERRGDAPARLEPDPARIDLAPPADETVGEDATA